MHTDSEDVEEPLPLLLLSESMKKRMLTKLDYWTIRNFEGTCTDLRGVSSNINPEINAHLLKIVFLGENLSPAVVWTIIKDGKNADKKASEEIFPKEPILCRISAQYVSIESPLTIPAVLEMVKIARRDQLSGNEIQIRKMYDIEGLIQIIEALRIEEIRFDGVKMQRRLTEFDTFRNLSSIASDVHDLEDEDFLQLSAPFMDFKGANLSPQTLNTLLKQWKAGERNIHGIKIETFSYIPCDKVDEILDGLDVSVIWNQEWHDHSLLFDEDVREKDLLLYSSCKCDDIYNPLIIIIDTYFIEILADSDEISYLSMVY